MIGLEYCMGAVDLVGYFNEDFLIYFSFWMY